MNKESVNNKVKLKKGPRFKPLFSKKACEYWDSGPLTRFGASKRFQTVMSGHSEQICHGVDCECNSAGKGYKYVVPS
jgi:hypothetical protein